MKLCKTCIVTVSFLMAWSPVYALDDLKTHLANSSNPGSFEEYVERYKRYFNKRNVDGVDGLSENDRRLFIERETNRFLSDAEARLNKHDIDGNGIATAQEIDTVARRTYGYQPTQPLEETEQRRVDNLVRLFLKGDVDGDGAVAKEEILANEERNIDRMVAQNQMIFDAFLNGTDSDGDGIVQFSDIEHGLAILLNVQ